MTDGPVQLWVPSLRGIMMPWLLMTIGLQEREKHSEYLVQSHVASCKKQKRCQSVREGALPFYLAKLAVQLLSQSFRSPSSDGGMEYGLVM